MKSSFAVFFSYLFMTAAIVSMVSILCLIVVFLRHFTNTGGTTEMETARYFLAALVIGGVLTPLSLYLSDRLGKLDGKREKI